MLERAIKDQAAGAMRSPVNWAVLGLAIERPSYGYEILRRFERNYGGLLRLSSASQIYTALDSLVERELLEATSEPPAGAASRQPRLHYRATEKGVQRYQEHLIGQAEEGRRRASLFTRELAALAPDAALVVLERYEQICLAQVAKPRLEHAGSSASDSSTSLADRLTAEEERLTIEAKLPWIEFARRELRAAADRDRHGPA